MFTEYRSAADQAALSTESIFQSASARLEMMLALLPEEFPKPSASDFLCYRYGDSQTEEAFMAQDYVLATGFKGAQTVQSAFLLRHCQQERIWSVSRHFHVTHKDIAVDFHADIYKPDKIFKELKEYLATFYNGFFTLRPEGYIGARADLAAHMQTLYGGAEKSLTQLAVPTRRQRREFSL